jgi:hypothetical protein
MSPEPDQGVRRGRGRPPHHWDGTGAVVSEDSYARALQRIIRFSLALAAAGAIATLIVRGPRESLGFLVGAALSFVNIRALTTVVNAVGGGSVAPSLRASVLFLALRYLVFIAVIYVIVKVLKITPAAVLAGLLVTFAAVMLEALYELIYART